MNMQKAKEKEKTKTYTISWSNQLGLDHKYLRDKKLKKD